jgi:hypothetical protein
MSQAPRNRGMVEHTLKGPAAKKIMTLSDDLQLLIQISLYF